MHRKTGRPLRPLRCPLRACPYCATFRKSRYVLETVNTFLIFPDISVPICRGCRSVDAEMSFDTTDTFPPIQSLTPRRIIGRRNAIIVISIFRNFSQIANSKDLVNYIATRAMVCMTSREIISAPIRKSHRGVHGFLRRDRLGGRQSRTNFILTSRLHRHVISRRASRIAHRIASRVASRRVIVASASRQRQRPAPCEFFTTPERHSHMA